MKDFTKEQILTMMQTYFCDPTDSRTQKEFCEDAGISDQTFRNYKRDHHDYIFDYAEKNRKAHIPELRAMGYRALAARLKKSDNAAKLLFQLLGDLVERSEVKTEILTVEQKRERLSNLMHDLRMKQLNPSIPVNRTELTKDESKHES